MNIKPDLEKYLMSLNPFEIEEIADSPTRVLFLSERMSTHERDVYACIDAIRKANEPIKDEIPPTPEEVLQRFRGFIDEYA